MTAAGVLLQLGLAIFLTLAAPPSVTVSDELLKIRVIVVIFVVFVYRSQGATL